MFDGARFAKMKDGALFINVSRGKLVRTPALVAALKAGKLAGAALDVTDPEPLPADHPLWDLPNVLVTSHIAGQSQHSWNRTLAVFTENVRRFTLGLPLLNVVDKEAGF
jgi:phosphoglycerate dehydrogenase-like enzyme